MTLVEFGQGSPLLTDFFIYIQMFSIFTFNTSSWVFFQRYSISKEIMTKVIQNSASKDTQIFLHISFYIVIYTTLSSCLEPYHKTALSFVQSKQEQFTGRDRNATSLNTF